MTMSLQQEDEGLAGGRGGKLEDASWSALRRQMASSEV